MSSKFITPAEWRREGDRAAIPVTAFTWDGFHEWVFSEECPDHARPSYLGPYLHVELGDQGVFVPRTVGTLKGFCKWAESRRFPKKGRIRFADQEVLIDMSPEELETHNQVKSEINSVLYMLNRRHKLGKYYHDRALVTNEAANLSSEPDGTFVESKTLKQGRVTLKRRRSVQGQYTQIIGSPDWVMEVVSWTSERDDTGIMKELYHRAGVREYWIVDALGKKLEFQVWVRKPQKYVRAHVEDRWQYSPVFMRWVRLTRKKDAMDLWEYRLHLRQ